MWSWLKKMSKKKEELGLFFLTSNQESGFISKFFKIFSCFTKSFLTWCFIDY